MANFDPEEDLSELLHVLSRDKLAKLLLSAARSDPSTHSNVRRAVDADPSHRDLYVTGFGADATEDSLRRIFSPFGEIERLTFPVDDNGRPRGYAFVLFRHLASAKKALKRPHKRIDGASRKKLSCSHKRSARKVYVRNLPQIFGGLEKLTEFFEQYGEIELVTPIDDVITEQLRNVSFLYKTLEGAVRALYEPIKDFDGHILLCQKEGEFKYPNAGAMGARYGVYDAPGMGGVDLGGSASSVQPAPHAAGTGVHLGGAAGSYQHGPTGGGFSQHKDLSGN